MTTPVIIDAIMVIILAVFVLCGIKRGLLKSLAGLIIVIVSLVGAGMIASTLVEPMTGMIAPAVQGKILDSMERALSEQREDWAENSAELPVPQLLELLGLDEEAVDELAKQAEDGILETSEEIVAAAVGSLIRSFVYGVLFLLAFIVLMLLLKVLVGAMGLVMKLPGLKGLNALGGGLFGLVQGVLLVFLAVWLARQMGVSFEKDFLSKAHILPLFMGDSPLDVVTRLQ